MRPASTLLLALAVAAVAALGGGAYAQPKAAPPKPLEAFERFRGTLAEGRYDVAGILLEEFLKVVPTAEELARPDEKVGTAVFLDIERKYGTTVFQSLRNVPRYSDDPATEKVIRERVEEVNRRAAAVARKVLYNPERVAKFIRNLGATFEERAFAQQELKRTGDFAVPFLVDALRTNPTPELYGGILETIPVLERPTTAGWVAALDALSPQQQYGVLGQLAQRRDARTLLTTAQTDFTPFLWRVLSRPRADGPALYDLAARIHNELVPGPKADTKRPEVELTAAAQRFYDHKARYDGVKGTAGGPNTVPVWVTAPQGEALRLARQDDVPVGQADEHFGLKYARWALEAKPDYQPAQLLVLGLAAERAVERAKFGSLATAEPGVYRLLADAPSAALIELLSGALAERRTAVVLAAVQALGDRADRAAATPPAGPVAKPSLLVRALSYPDHAVQFAAASALLRSPVPVPAEVKVKIVEVLRRAAGADGAKPAESKGTVLLVDPGKFRADAAAALLRGFGYDVEILASGRDLQRRIARSSDFDLIFIDHHTAGPELRDLIAQVTADPRAAGRPLFVIASPDKPRPPTFEQLLLRMAQLVAATDAEPYPIPAPFVPSLLYTAEEQAAQRRAVQQQRDRELPRAARVRADRLRKVLDTLPLTLDADQRQVLDLRVQQVTFAALAGRFPITPESSPETVAELERLRTQLARLPRGAADGTPLAVAELMKLIERYEIDVARSKPAQDEYDFLRAKVTAESLGLPVETFRDPAAEARVRKTLVNYPEVKVISEPYTPLALEDEFRVLFADPAMVPREGGVKKAEARAAVGFLRQMAVGDLPGYDFRAAEAELRTAVATPTDPDVASAAVDAVERLTTAEAQQALLRLATQTVGEAPPALRRKAADAAIRHARANGKLATPALLTDLTRQATADATKDPELLGKLLTLKGMLVSDPNGFGEQLRQYNPPLVPAEPKKEPEKKEAEKKDPPM